MVIRLRDDGTAAMMSIPRDLAAEIAGTSDIAGTGVIAKINSAYNRDRTTAGRAARLIDTVEENLDITLQHFVEVDFQAFLRLVDAIGGVTMTFSRPLRDQPKPRTQPIRRTAAAGSSPARAPISSTAGRRLRTFAAAISKSSSLTEPGSGTALGTISPATTASASSCALPQRRSHPVCSATRSGCSRCSTSQPTMCPRRTR